MKSNVCKYILGILIFIQTNIFAAEEKAYLDASTIIESWESNYYHKIKNVDIVYSQHLVKENFVGIDTQKLPKGITPQDVVRDYDEARISDYHSKKYYCETANIKDAFDNKESRLKYAFDGKNTTYYLPSDNLGVIEPGLAGRSVEYSEDIKPIMLLTTLNVKTEDYPDGMPELTRIFKCSKTKVLPTIETVSGEQCHVMELEATISSGEKYEWKVWMAHNKNMLPLKYQEFINGQLSEEIGVEEIGAAESATGVIWYPKIANRTTDSKFFGQTTYKFVTHSFKPNIETTEDTFRVKFPPGAKIIDKVKGMEYELVGSEIDSLPEFHTIDTPPVDKPESAQKLTSVEIKNTPSNQEKTNNLSTQKNKQAEDSINKNVENKDVTTKQVKNLKVKTIVLIIAVIVISGLLLFLWSKKQMKLGGDN